MTDQIDFTKLYTVVVLLERVSDDGKLAALKNVADSNMGRYDLPSAAAKNGKPIYDPILKTIEVCGVHAMAEDIADLPMNWIRAATNILVAQAPEDAA